MNAETIKVKAFALIDKNREKILAVERKIWKHPETGFKEEQTGQLAAEVLKDLGLPCKTNLAVTGCRADLEYDNEGSRLAILGELDSIILPTHPAADPITGAVHACGHHLQIANLVAAAIALSSEEVARYLGGSIAFIAVPAEEFLETGYRLSLVKQGIIRYCGGKAEMIRLGVFNDIDAAIMVHSGNGYAVAESYNGFFMKKVTFIGKAAHGGLSPWEGINALHAANLALDAVNAQRETFKDEDSVRVHSIITKGGTAVNVVPDEVVLEIQVRAKTKEAVIDASHKVDRAMQAGALAIGARVRVETVPGYMPLKNNLKMSEIVFSNIQVFEPDFNRIIGGHRGSSTDMGDLGMIMPVIHPGAAGCSGTFHSADFQVADEEKAAIESSKVLVGSVIDLLCEKAAALRGIVNQSSPQMSRKEYLALMEKTFNDVLFDYRENTI